VQAPSGPTGDAARNVPPFVNSSGRVLPPTSPPPPAPDPTLQPPPNAASRLGHPDAPLPPLQ
jgi:hypothetical protein